MNLEKEGEEISASAFFLLNSRLCGSITHFALSTSVWSGLTENIEFRGAGLAGQEHGSPPPTCNTISTITSIN
jgi:hypothetical protein